MGNIKSIKMKKQKALILIDLQNDYFEGGLYPLVGSLDAVLKAQKLIHYFRLNSLPVIYIRHISSRQDATFFLPDTIGAEIHSSVTPIKNEDIIIKHSPNSFYQTELNFVTIQKCHRCSYLWYDDTHVRGCYRKSS